MEHVLEKLKQQIRRNKAKPLMISRQRVPDLFPGLSPKTLANLYSEGKGPKVYKRGKSVFYLVEDLVEYLTQDPRQNLEEGKNECES